MKEVYSQLGILPSRNVAGSHFRALSKIPDCRFRMELGPCLSPDVAVHPLRPATDHWLGRLLLYQLPNPAKHHLRAINLSYEAYLSGIFKLLNLKEISFNYSGPKGRTV